ncbi:MAG: GntR family transcriptional regulator [Xanthobacteraceae bacterium]|jgi:DNA-binding GntR family transcriptional regulator|nr:GntR family transcriptional regulator [Xanthobacteraceae bacterium]
MSKKPQRAKAARTRKDAFQTIRNRISEHELLPGSKLREQEMAAEFGLSRAHVRDIFGALEQRGLIVRVPNRGAMVAYLDPAQAINLYHVREALEGLAARLAAGVAPKGTWDDLLKRFTPSIEAKLRKGEYTEYEAILNDLNRRIIRYANNPILSDMLDRIHDRTQVMARRVVVLQGRAELGFDLHRKLTKALASGDAEAAAAMKSKIIATARESIDRYRDFIF